MPECRRFGDFISTVTNILNGGQQLSVLVRQNEFDCIELRNRATGSGAMKTGLSDDIDGFLVSARTFPSASYKQLVLLHIL